MQLKAEKAGKRGIAPGTTQRAPAPRSTGSGGGSTGPGAVSKYGK